MDAQAYLIRIGADAPNLRPTLPTLRTLQRRHMLTVPFENLDIHLKRPIILEAEHLYAKIVGNGRGGFCHELNGAFAALLTALRYDVTLLSARVWNGSGFGQEFEHMALLVGVQEAWLVDVGFGDSSLLPLRFTPGDAQYDGQRAYRLIEGGDAWIMQECDWQTGEWVNSYTFTLKPRRLADYAHICRWQQTAPESTFTQKLVCSRATETGRISLSGARLIHSTGARREELALPDAEAVRAALREHFRISLSLEDVNTMLASAGVTFGATA